MSEISSLCRKSFAIVNILTDIKAASSVAGSVLICR